MNAGVAEIVSSLYGAWRLLRLDPAAMTYFNVTIGGFFRSFLAAVLSLPYFLLSLLWPASAVEGEMARSAEPVAALAGYALSWIVFPAVAAFLARLFELTRSYVGFIIAFNWANALVAQPLLALQLMVHGGLLSPEVFGMLQLPVVFFVLWYGWAVARIALGASPWLAGALIAIAKMIDVALFATLIRPVA